MKLLTTNKIIVNRLLFTIILFTATALLFSVAHAQEAETATDEVVSEVSSTPTVSTDPTELGYSVEGFPGNDAVIGDFVVGPGKVEVELDPGETKYVEITATNRTGVDRIFKFDTEDIAGTVDGSKSVILLGEDRGPYSLKDYLDIPKGGVMIKHGQRVRIPVAVRIPADAEPGGLYGSVLVQTVTLPAKESEDGKAVVKSPLVTRIGTLFFVTIGGGTEREGELKTFSTIPDKTFYASGPIKFGLLYENTGTIHTTPYGEIEIFNYAGKSVGFVELDPWFALPKSLRTREVSWNRELLIGKYTAVARVNRGYDDIVDEKEIVFWVFPWKVGLLLFAGLFVFFFILRFFFRSFEFRRKQN